MKYTLIVALLLTSLPSMAAEKSSGCGLGWKFTKKMTTSASSTRTTTNTTFSNTFGMTSGTSGCDFHEIVRQEKQKIHFVESNLFPLQLEMALGQGERLAAVSKLFGCSEMSVESFSQVMKKNHIRIFQDVSAPEAVVSELEALVQGDPLLRSQCALKT